MGPWWWWAGRFTLSLAFVFLFCSLFCRRVTVCAAAGRLQTASGHNSFNTHLDVTFSVCSWQMKNTGDCSSDSSSSVYDLYVLHQRSGRNIREMFPLHGVCKLRCTIYVTFHWPVWKVKLHLIRSPLKVYHMSIFYICKTIRNRNIHFLPIKIVFDTSWHRILFYLSIHPSIYQSHNNASPVCASTNESGVTEWQRVMWHRPNARDMPLSLAWLYLKKTKSCFHLCCCWGTMSWTNSRLQTQNGKVLKQQSN